MCEKRVEKRDSARGRKRERVGESGIVEWESGVGESRVGEWSGRE